MITTQPGVRHPETIDMPDDMLKQVEQAATESSMTTEEWILAAIREKVHKVSDTQKVAEP